MTRAAVVLLLVSAVCLITGATLWFGRPALVAGLLVVGVLSLAAACVALTRDVDEVSVAPVPDEELDL